jgi:hypothetical protein
MSRLGLLLALAVLILVGGTVAPAARAVDPYVVDIQECERNNGQATVPAGVPVSVQNFAFVAGTYGLMQDFLLKQVTSKGVFRDGVLTIVDFTDQWSEPEQLGTNPARGWVTHLPNTELDSLAQGEIVTVGILIRFTGPIQIAFPPVGQTDFGPFHIPADQVFLQACEITAV